MVNENELFARESAWIYEGRDIKDTIKILFICHESISKSPEKASKINRFTKQKGAYSTTITAFRIFHLSVKFDFFTL